MLNFLAHKRIAFSNLYPSEPIYRIAFDTIAQLALFSKKRLNTAIILYYYRSKVFSRLL